MPLFRTILFAADFSDRSRAAFQAACSLAHVQKTRLFVLHVAEPKLADGLALAPGEPGAWIPLGDDGRAQIEALEDRLRAFYAPACPIDVTYHVRDGLAVEEILRMSDEIGSDLIVLGTHGRTGLGRLLAGSVAESVLHEARCPVLAVRCSVPAREARPARVLLHPTDFSGCSEAALRVARALARDHGARLVVLHAAPLEVFSDGTAVLADRRLDQDALEEIRGRIEGPDLEFRVETLLGQGDPAALILRAAWEVRAGLIVMGTHGRTGLGRLLMGSVAETVLRGSRGPVLVVKAPPREKGARPVGSAGKSMILY